MRRVFSILMIAAASTMALPPLSAQAWTKKVLYNFTGGTDGYGPVGVVRNSTTGDLYGTTVVGGAHNEGTIFKIAKDGTKSVLYSFTGGGDGARPYDGPIKDDAGNLFGTTYDGGTNNLGVIYKLAQDGTYTVLHTFNGSDGEKPGGRLHFDRKTGDLYGITEYGGAGPGYGTVFRAAANGKFAVLHSFSGSDGRNPAAGLIMDSSGNLYGTTEYGGNLSCHSGVGCGTVFMITPQGKETVLHAFTTDVAGRPDGELIWDDAGNLYGTVLGGKKCSGGLFKLTRSRKLKFLHKFSCSDPAGAAPSGHIVMDKSGAIYGTTEVNGANDPGTVYQYSDHAVQALIALDGVDNNGIIQDKDGNLYGATVYGGTGYGTVFEVVK